MNIDFSKAPEGATHYGYNALGRFHWYNLISEKQYLVWNETLNEWRLFPFDPPCLELTIINGNKFQNKQTITEDDLVGGLHVVNVISDSGENKYIFLQKCLYIGWNNPKSWMSGKYQHEITKVYEISKSGTAFTCGDDKYLTLIWEKPAKEEPIEEMTVAQVSAALGKKIKIIEG